MTSRPAIAVYIMANRKHGAIYIGVTSNLIKRVHEHRMHAVDGFTKEHGLDKLVYYELHQEMTEAIHREKRLKKYTRAKKIELIESKNAEWDDLWDSITA